MTLRRGRESSVIQQSTEHVQQSLDLPNTADCVAALLPRGYACQGLDDVGLGRHVSRRVRAWWREVSLRPEDVYTWKHPFDKMAAPGLAVWEEVLASDVRHHVCSRSFDQAACRTADPCDRADLAFMALRRGRSSSLQPRQSWRQQPEMIQAQTHTMDPHMQRKTPQRSSELAELLR